MKTLAFGLLLAAVSTAALAQTATPPANNTPNTPPASQTATPPAAAAPADTAPSAAAPSNTGPSITAHSTAPAGLQPQIASDLKNAGYTDVTVQPGLYVAQGKKNGEAVTLLIGPGSVTEIIMGDAVPTGTSASGSKAASDVFTTVPAGDELSSQVVGTSVTNKDGKDIGTIKDVVFTPQGAVKAYILGIGGFLGVGDRYVAVRPSAVKLTYDSGAKKWRAAMDTDADSLKKAPEYKYPS